MSTSAALGTSRDNCLGDECLGGSHLAPGLLQWYLTILTVRDVENFSKSLNKTRKALTSTRRSSTGADTKMTEPTGKHRGFMVGKVVLSNMCKVSKEASSTHVIPTTLPPGPSTISGMDGSPMIHNHDP